MIVHDVIQGSDEWMALRAGKFTASRFGDLFAKKETATWSNFVNDVVYGRLAGEAPDHFSNYWMQRGIELEPAARLAYELATFTKVQTVGFVEMDEWTGASPDGLIGKDGMLQIKCPKTSTLIETHLTGKIPQEYYWQMMGEMLVSGRRWVDYWVWHPKIKPFLRRLPADEAAFDQIRNELRYAIATAKSRMERIAA